MIKFKVSAPGKVILYGEPLAMYEKYAVAASVDLRTTLKFCELTDELSIIKIEFPDVNLSLILSLELILNFFFGNNCTDLRDNILLLKHVQYFITINGMWTTYEQRFSLQTFFFLLIYMIHYEELDIKSFRVHLTTKLPISAGLGSSTSFAVCIAACFLHWGRLQKGDDGVFSDLELETISEYAKNCEEVVQNYITEVDHDVCSYGQMIRYRYDSRNKGVNILDVPRMKILLIDSKIRQNKREQMEQFAKMNYYSPTNSICNLLDGLSNQACQKLVEINNNMTVRQLQETYAALGIYILLNQQLLYELGVSHPKLDSICAIAKTHGFAGKLTNFGGRYVYILLPPNTPREKIMNLSTHLTTEGFTVTMTSVSCNGARIDDLY